MKEVEDYDNELKCLSRISVLSTDTMFHSVYYEQILATFLLNDFENSHQYYQNYLVNNDGIPHPAILYLSFLLKIELHDFYTLNKEFNSYLIENSLDSNLLNSFQINGQKLVDKTKVNSLNYLSKFFRIKEGKKGFQNIGLLTASSAFVILSSYHQLYLQSVMTGLPLIGRFVKGGKQNLKSLIKRNNDQEILKQKKVFREKLLKYHYLF